VNRNTTSAVTHNVEKQAESSDSEYYDEEEDASATLDNNVSLITRKNTMGVKGNLIQAEFLQNMEKITESVEQFSKMTENNAENDIVSHYKAEEENYKQEMEKL